MDALSPTSNLFKLSNVLDAFIFCFDEKMLHFQTLLRTFFLIV